MTDAYDPDAPLTDHEITELLAALNGDDTTKHGITDFGDHGDDLRRALLELARLRSIRPR